MLRERNILIESRPQYPLYGTLRYLEPVRRPRRLLVLCHGFAATSKWGFIPKLSESLTDETTATLALNFSRNGTREGSGDIVDFQALRDNCYRAEEDDLAAVVQAFSSASTPPKNEDFKGMPLRGFSEMFLFGHSRGADSVLGFASRCSHVSGVIVLNAKSKVRAVSPEIAARWRTRGYWEEMDFGSGRRIPLGTDFLDEIERVETRIEQAARTLQCPLLAMHGERDQHTPPSHSKILAEWAIRATMVLMPEADHFLTGPRPEDSELHVSRLTHYIRSFMTGD